MKKLDKKPIVAVIGGGNGGMAFAAAMALQGAEVRLYDSEPAALAPVRERGWILLGEDEQERPAHVAAVTTDPRQAVDGANLIMVVVPASAHAAVIETLAPYLTDDAVIVLNPGRTGGALEARGILDSLGASPAITVAEAQTLLFACRKRDGGKVVINGVKQWVPLAALPLCRTSQVIAMLTVFFPQFVPASSVLETSLGNIGAIFHPSPTLLNVARIETTAGNFEYYREGISRSVAKLLECIDAERLAVARALGVPALSALKWLEQAYGISGCTSLYEAIQSNPAYRGIMAPKSIDVRYITEDVPTGLVPIASLARRLGIATPIIDATVNLACQMLNRDFWREGRNEDKLGIARMSREQMLHLVV